MLTCHNALLFFISVKSFIHLLPHAFFVRGMVDASECESVSNLSEAVAAVSSEGEETSDQ